jgi:MFS family permease
MMQPKPKNARRWLATAAMAGVASYIAIDVVLQFLPPHYSVLHDAESNLAVGPFGWIMNLNFLGRGVTTLCAIAAINRVGHASGLRRGGVFLLAVGGVCSAILAFFPTDVVPGSGLVAVTTAGTVHLFVAGLGFLAALAGILLLTGWMRTVRELQGTYRAALTLAIITALGLVLLGLSATLGSAFLGLAERVCLLGVLGWVVVICRAILYMPRRSGPIPPAGMAISGQDPPSA